MLGLMWRRDYVGLKGKGALVEELDWFANRDSEALLSDPESDLERRSRFNSSNPDKYPSLYRAPSMFDGDAYMSKMHKDLRAAPPLHAHFDFALMDAAPAAGKSPPAAAAAASAHPPHVSLLGGVRAASGDPGGDPREAMLRPFLPTREAAGTRRLVIDETLTPSSHAAAVCRLFLGRVALPPLERSLAANRERLAALLRAADPEAAGVQARAGLGGLELARQFADLERRCGVLERAFEDFVAGAQAVSNRLPARSDSDAAGAIAAQVAARAAEDEALSKGRASEFGVSPGDDFLQEWSPKETAAKAAKAARAAKAAEAAAGLGLGPSAIVVAERRSLGRPPRTTSTDGGTRTTSAEGGVVFFERSTLSAGSVGAGIVGASAGLYFKPTTAKKSWVLAHFPVNLHVHSATLQHLPKAGGATASGAARSRSRLGAKDEGARAPSADGSADGAAAVMEEAVEQTVSFGAPAAHSLGFKHGGLRQVWAKLGAESGAKGLLRNPEATLKYLELRFAAKARETVVLGQALGGLATAASAQLGHLVAGRDAAGVAQVWGCGLLVHSACLLTTAGDEAAMIDDFAGAYERLKHVALRFLPPRDDDDDDEGDEGEFDEYYVAHGGTEESDGVLRVVSVDPTAEAGSGKPRAKAWSEGEVDLLGPGAGSRTASVGRASVGSASVGSVRSSSFASSVGGDDTGSLAGNLGLKALPPRTTTAAQAASGLGAVTVTFRLASQGDFAWLTGVLAPAAAAARPRLAATARYLPPVTVVPVLFNVGVNEFQTVANASGSGTSAQAAVNLRGCAELRAYASAVASFASVPGAPVSKHAVEVGALLAEMDAASVAEAQRPRKDVSVLLLGGAAARLLKGARTTSCKSAKDRTSMFQTLEVARAAQRRGWLRK
jgi:hypothetical protein